MKGNNFRTYTKHYDHIYLKKKHYRKETEIIKDIIEQFEEMQSKTLLDVGCGTGEHLKYLSLDFQCTGIDINRDMIRTAKNKVPNAKFKVANIINFSLKEAFDVIICLFSSIGYVQSVNNLVRTLENFHEHLNSGGLAIVEPWIFKEDFKKGIYVDTYEDEEIKLVRMATSEIVRSRWMIFMHYLIGEKGKIRYDRELHKMLALDYQDYVEAFESTRFENMKFLKENLWNGCRGLFVATK